MLIREIYTMKTSFRQEMMIKGYSFGRGSRAACILGSSRGDEIQQMYVCSQLVRALKELEANNCINSNKEILVIPVINNTSMNEGKRFFGESNLDINRNFPGRENADAVSRIADGVFQVIKEYSYGMQFTSFYLQGEFVPHVRMMETGYQNASLANLFGLPYVLIKKPLPIDTATLNYNWQSEMTAAFSVYANQTERIDEDSARQAVAAVLRFLKRMGIIKYESHSGYISHVIMEEELCDVKAETGGIFRRLVKTGEDVRYKAAMAEILDPYEGSVKQVVTAPTDGIVFFSHTNPLIGQYDTAYQLIHRLHQ